MNPQPFPSTPWRTPLPLAVATALHAALLPAALIANPARAQTQPLATQAEICYSPSFGEPTVIPRVASHGFCAGAPAGRRTQTQIFWVPGITTPSGLTCVPTGNVSAALSNNRQIYILSVLNLDARRRATITGNGQANVLVGSPSTSDILVGGGGQDTYVVGGLSTVVVAPDRLFPVSTTSEIDDITFGGDPEYIYINPGTDGQNNPGPLNTPSLGSITPRGAAAIPAALRTSPSLPRSAPTCIAATGQPVRFASLSVPSPLLASLPGSSGYTERPRPAGPAGFPGTPTLRGFGLEPGNTDRLFVPAAGFTFRGVPINQLIDPGQGIKVLVVDQVRFDAAKVVSPQRLRWLLAKARSQDGVRSEEAPLIYFRQNGLLVFSQNGEPLGSSANPGRVIAQLLDRNGRPLRLPTSAAEPYYIAKFLEFTPPAQPYAGSATTRPR